MTVSELISKLQKCNPDDIVMYDCEMELLNDEDGILYGEALNEMTKNDMPVHQINMGVGEKKGYIYLSAEPKNEAILLKWDMR